MRVRLAITFALVVLFAGAERAARAQMDYGNRLGLSEEGRIVYPISGVNVQMEALDPTIMRWYMPQELFVLEKDADGNFSTSEVLPVAFVPLTGEGFADG